MGLGNSTVTIGLFGVVLMAALGGLDLGGEGIKYAVMALIGFWLVTGNMFGKPVNPLSLA